MKRGFLALLLCASLLALPLLGPEPGSSAGRGTGTARIVFVGDLMMGRYVGSYMAAYGYDKPFAEIKTLISGADLAIGNLEGPIVPAGVFTIPRAYPNLLTLTGNARAAGALQRAGFDLLSLANNHAYDARLEGLKATEDALRGVGIDPLGLDGSGGQVPIVREAHGLKIAFLAYTTVQNIWLKRVAGMPFVSYVNPNVKADRERLAKEVSRARQSADVVVLVMHWGNEYKAQSDVGQKRLAQVAAQAGADLVVGAHPHVAQGMETIVTGDHTTLVAYSLGNALFDQMAKQETRQGLALECVVAGDGVRSARLIPLEIRPTRTGYVMHVADAASGQPTLYRAAMSTPASLLWRAVWDARAVQPGIALAYRRSPDKAQATDEELGTGAPTRLQLSDGVLSVSVQEAAGGYKTAWKSEPGWRVTGYTVGDADADGRPDLVYTLWKRALASSRPPGGGLEVDRDGGALLPHLYVNGWRDGAIRPVWHGSSRPAPVLAVAIAPVGKAHKPLLATLESSDPKAERVPGRVRLWEWTGGFGYELAAEVQGLYSQMWTDGRILLGR